MCVILRVTFVCVIYVYVACVAVGVCVCGMSMLSVRTYGACMICVRVVCVCGLVVVACVGMRVYVRAYCLFEQTNVHCLPVLAEALLICVCIHVALYAYPPPCPYLTL